MLQLNLEFFRFSFQTIKKKIKKSNAEPYIYNKIIYNKSKIIKRRLQ